MYCIYVTCPFTFANNLPNISPKITHHCATKKPWNTNISQQHAPNPWGREGFALFAPTSCSWLSFSVGSLKVTERRIVPQKLEKREAGASFSQGGVLMMGWKRPLSFLTQIASWSTSSYVILLLNTIDGWKKSHSQLRDIVDLIFLPTDLRWFDRSLQLCRMTSRQRHQQ